MTRRGFSFTFDPPGLLQLSFSYPTTRRIEVKKPALFFFNASGNQLGTTVESSKTVMSDRPFALYRLALFKNALDADPANGQFATGLHWLPLQGMTSEVGNTSLRRSANVA
jgi:hypothetical protein